MNGNMKIPGGHDEDLITRLIRKQIDDLRLILCELESGKVLNDYTYENLKHVEQQIHWLRTLALG